MVAKTEEMPKSKTLDAEEEGSTSFMENVVHDVLTNSLESPISETKLRYAYDTLLSCCPDNGDDYSFHQDPYPKKISIDSIRVLCDYYRAFLVVSFLLRLEGSNHLRLSSCSEQQQLQLQQQQTLEESVERCIWLLQILVAAPTELDLVNRLPVSKYPLLNSLFHEPLIPLCRDARQSTFASFTDKEADTLTTTSIWEEEEEEDDSSSQHIFFLRPSSKAQLALEEKELLAMASRPIPSDSQTNVTDIHDDSWRISPSFQLPNDIMAKDQNVRLYRCGILDFDSTSSILLSPLEARNIKVCTNQVEIQLNDGRYMNIPLTYSTCEEWKEAIESICNDMQTQELLRHRAMDFWNVSEN
jgi:hypothetical protein